MPRKRNSRISYKETMIQMTPRQKTAFARFKVTAKREGAISIEVASENGSFTALGIGSDGNTVINWDL